MIDPLALADTMGGSDLAAAKAARASLASFTHAAAAPNAGAGQRRETIKALTEIATSKRPRMVRAHALHLLGLVGGKGELRAIAPLENDPEVGEDARMATTRLMRGSK
ncbi:MAG: hypothetical protein QM758_11200 [Armatimonas sp.]